MAGSEFSGKRVLVTGGASGIGYAIAKGFCDMGAHVMIADISAEIATGAAENLRDAGGTADWHHVDVASARSVSALMDKIGPRLDTLVCAAGTFVPGTAEETTDESWERVIGVNLTGTFNCARSDSADAPEWRRHNYRIVFDRRP